MADFDPDAYLAKPKAFDPDAYLADKPFDPDAYLAKPPAEEDEYSLAGLAKKAARLKNAAISGVAQGVAETGLATANFPLKAIAGVAGMAGDTETADKLFAQTDSKKQAMEQFFKENQPTMAPGSTEANINRAAKSVGGIPGMVNPATGLVAAGGGVTDLHATLRSLGVDEETANEAAALGFVPGMVTGSIPFLNMTAKAAAGTNVATGGASDWAIRALLTKRGYGKIAQEMFDPTDPVARGTDILAGLAGGGHGTPNAKGEVRNAAEGKAALDRLQAERVAKEEAAKTVSPDTLYVGKDGVADKTLPGKVTEDPAVTELARTRLQNEGAAQAVSPWTPNQPDMFPMATGEQLGLDLRTEPDRSGLARQEDLTQERQSNTATYNEGDAGVTPVKSTAASDAQANMIWHQDQAKIARRKGDEELAQMHDNRAAQAKQTYENASKEFAPKQAENRVAQQQTPEFKSWFGNSVTKTRDGLARIFYHGTNAADFTEFRPNSRGLIFVTPDASIASNFSQSHGLNTKDGPEFKSPSRVLPVYVRAENPFTFWKDANARALADRMFEGIAPGKRLNIQGHSLTYNDFMDKIVRGDWGILEEPRTIAALKELGHDSLYVREGGQHNLAVFDPNQLKSATGNNGEFSRKTIDLVRAEDGREPLADHPAIFDMGFPGESGLQERTIRFPALESYDKGTGHFDPREVISILRQTHNDKKNLPYGHILDMLDKALARLGDKAPKFFLEVDADGNPQRLVKQRYQEDSAAAAHYDPNDDVVRLGLAGTADRTFVHEFVHALTTRALYMYRETDPMVRDLHRLFKEVQANPEFFKKENGEPMYGLKDIHEFIAEAFSNPDFQAQLAFFIPKKTNVAQNMLHRFTEAVLVALGFKKEGEWFKNYAKAMNDLFFHTEKLMEAYSAEKELFDQQWETWSTTGTRPNSVNTLALDKATGGAISRPDKIAEALKVGVKSQDPDSIKAEKLKDVTGVEWISKDPDVTDPKLKEKILSEKDGSGTWALTPGALVRSLLAGSTLVGTIHTLFDNASKRTRLLTKQIVEPVEKTLGKVLTKGENANILHDLLMREMKNGEDYSADDLRRVGIPESVIQARMEFRALMQSVGELQQQAQADKGQKPFSLIDAYMSARFSGPWRATIKDKEGKVLWQIAEHNIIAANRAKRYIQSQMPDVVIESPRYTKGFERGGNMEAAYADMLKLLDPDDPRTQVFQDVYKDYVLQTTDDIAQQEKHFQKKTGVRGYAGDRPWAPKDSRDMFIQQIEYAKNAIKWSQYQKATEKSKILLGDKEVADAQPNNVAFSKDYAKIHIGYGTKEFFNSLDNMVAKYTGTSPKTIQSGIGGAKTYFYLSRLAAVVPFIVTQFIQPLISTPAVHSLLGTEGFKHNPVQTLLMGLGKGTEAILWHYASEFGMQDKFENMMDGVDKDALRYMEANGIVDISPLTDIKKNLRPAIIKGIAYVPELTMRHPEAIARSWAFMSFVSHLKQSGKYDLSSKASRYEMFHQAEQMTQLAMTDYRPEERAQIFERMGTVVGDTSSTLKSYQFNNLGQYWLYSKKAMQGHPEPLVTFMFMQGISAGLSGMIAVDELDRALDLIKRLLPPEAFMRWKDKSIRGFMLENMNDLFNYGLFSAASGTNIQTRLKANPIIPGQLGDAAPFAGTAVDAAVAGHSLVTGEPRTRLMEKLYKAAPTALQGPMERGKDFVDPITGVNRNPNDLGKGKYKRTEGEKSLRDWGFKSLEEQKFQEKNYRTTKMEQILADRMRSSAEDAKDYILGGEMKKGVNALIAYEIYGGKIDTVINALPKARLEQATTELQRRAITASSGEKAAILKLQNYIKNVGMR